MAGKGLVSAELLQVFGTDGLITITDLGDEIMKAVWYALVPLFVCGCASPRHPDSDRDTIVAKSIVLVDEQGRQRIVINGTEDEPSITVYNASGKACIEAGLNSPESGFFILYGPGESQIWMQANDRLSLGIDDEAGKNRLILELGSGDLAEMIMRDRKGIGRLGFGLAGETGSPYIDLSGRLESHSVFIEVAPKDDAPQFTMWDQQGNVVFAMPAHPASSPDNE